MGKKKKKQKNNNNKQNIINKQQENNVISKIKDEQVIIPKDKQEELDEYINKKKMEADKYFEDKKLEADNLEKELNKTFEDKVNKKVEQEVKEKNRDLKDKEKKLDNDREQYNKDCAKLENEKHNYKKEQLEIVIQEMNSIIENNKTLVIDNEKLKEENRKLETRNKSLTSDNSELVEELKKISQTNGNNNALQVKIDSLEMELEKIKDMYKEKTEELKEKSLILLQCNNNPENLIKLNIDLTNRNKELNNQLQNCPSEEELKELRKTKQEFDILYNKYKELNNIACELKKQNEKFSLENSKLNDIQNLYELIKLQKEELESELSKTVELYKTNVESVFATLSMIDKQQFNSFENIDITLETICKQFKGYLANRSENPLYYDDTTIRSFIAGLASSKTMILEGLSGTGKTRLPMSFKDFANVKVEIISVQSSWKDRNDLLGYYNDFKKQYKETEFLKALYRACCDPNNIYLIVLDEMNLSRVEYYFADFLSVLENNENQWKIDLISDYGSINTSGVFPNKIHEGKLDIGNNVWFIGTANKDDSTFMISDKVYDRSTVLYFDKKGEKEPVEKAFEINLNKETLLRLLNNASIFKNPTDKEKCKNIIRDLDKKVINLFGITFGNRIEKQLEKFVPAYMECGGTLEEALDVVFSRKILRKLEGVYDDNIKENLEQLEEYIITRYNMPISIETIDNLSKNK